MFATSSMWKHEYRVRGTEKAGVFPFSLFLLGFFECVCLTHHKASQVQKVDLWSGVRVLSKDKWSKLIWLIIASYVCKEHIRNCCRGIAALSLSKHNHLWLWVWNMRGQVKIWKWWYSSRYRNMVLALFNTLKAKLGFFLNEKKKELMGNGGVHC